MREGGIGDREVIFYHIIEGGKVQNKKVISNIRVNSWNIQDT